MLRTLDETLSIPESLAERDVSSLAVVVDAVISVLVGVVGGPTVQSIHNFSQ